MAAEDGQNRAIDGEGDRDTLLRGQAQKKLAAHSRKVEQRSAG